MSQSNSIRNGIVIFIAFVVAIWLGVTIVTEQTETLLKIAGATLLITCIFLGRKIWLLLILFTALNVPIIRGFGTTELGQTLFVGFTVLITLMHRQPYRITFGEKEIWMLLLAGCILQVYFRHPVGLNMFGAGAVGARPYFMAGMAFLSSIILGNIVVRPAEIRLAFWLSIVGSLFGMFLSQWRGGLGVGPAAFEQGKQIDDGKGSGRIGILGSLSGAAANISVSFISPLRALLHPIWAPVILFALVAAAMSGYRNSVAYVGLILLVGLAYRSGGIAVIVSSVAGALALGLLAFVNVVSPLPANIQRALSPFPGTWEKRHVQAADESTEWRVEMWKEALFTDYWINNKILGDGLGFTRRELLMMEDLSAGGGNLDNRGSGMSTQQEAMMVTGGYHSGPVQTIRTVGYVGLAILLLAMIRIAVHAHRQILRCRGTVWFPLSLYFGIPAIVLPPFFFFIFGDFGKDVAALFLSYGMISLMEKNLPLPPYTKRRYVPYILKPKGLQNSDA
jgi:hypothetical protein